MSRDDDAGMLERPSGHPKELRPVRVDGFCSARLSPLDAAQRIGVQLRPTALTGPDPDNTLCRQLATQVNSNWLLLVRLQRLVGRLFAMASIDLVWGPVVRLLDSIPVAPGFASCECHSDLSKNGDGLKILRTHARFDFG